MTRILVVEDDEKLAALVRRGLEEDGFAADTAARGEDALWMASATAYDAVVLDVMLPGIDGFAVCAGLRDAGVWAPVLMLTARGAVEDRVRGLDGGADDYLVKPFALDELSARLRALVRRVPAERPAVLRVGDLRLDPAARRVARGEAPLDLTPLEFSLLEAFMRRPGRVLSRYRLLETVWDDRYENRSNVVDVYVGYLRQKIDRPFGRASLETVRGAGYRLREDGGVTGRVPVRLRLTLAFAAAMCVLLAVAVGTVRTLVSRHLDDQIGNGLEVRADEAEAALARGARITRPPPGVDEVLTAVIARDGSVTPAGTPALPPGLAGGGALDRVSLPGLPGPVRVLAVPSTAAPGATVVVAAALDDRDETLRVLTLVLAAAGSLGVVATSAAGYLLAAAALRPVERMRARAAALPGTVPGGGVPVPAARDELRRLAETMNAMLARIDAARARERAFVADAAHELRSPLAVLRAETELALRGGRTPEELRTALASVADEVQRLARLTEDLLTSARAAEGGLPLHLEAVDVAQVVARAARRHAAAFAATGRATCMEVDGPLPLTADALRLEQAVGNLLDNALRHGRGAVRVRAARSGGGVEITVADEGPGMDDDARATAFERLSRGDRARSRGGGTGLGLAIVRAICEAHGGTATLCNGDTGGVEARILLPGAGPA